MRELANIPLLQILTLVAFSGTEKLPKGWSALSCLKMYVSFMAADHTTMCLGEAGAECMEEETRSPMMVVF